MAGICVFLPFMELAERRFMYSNCIRMGSLSWRIRVDWTLAWTRLSTLASLIVMGKARLVCWVGSDSGQYNCLH